MHWIHIWCLTAPSWNVLFLISAFLILISIKICFWPSFWVVWPGTEYVCDSRYLLWKQLLRNAENLDFNVEYFRVKICGICFTSFSFLYFIKFYCGQSESLDICNSFFTGVHNAANIKLPFCATVLCEEYEILCKIIAILNSKCKNNCILL